MGLQGEGDQPRPHRAPTHGPEHPPVRHLVESLRHVSAQPIGIVLNRKGVDTSRMKVSGNAHLILPYHVDLALEELQEDAYRGLILKSRALLSLGRLADAARQ